MHTQPHYDPNLYLSHTVIYHSPYITSSSTTCIFLLADPQDLTRIPAVVEAELFFHHVQ